MNYHIHMETEVKSSSLTVNEARDALWRAELNDPNPPLSSRIQCRLCGEAFWNLERSYDHVTVHTGEFRYQCPLMQCNSVGHTAKEISNHYRIEHCNAVLRIRPVEIRPLVNPSSMCITGYLCGYCRFVQCSITRVRHHIRKYHKEELGATLAPYTNQITEINLMKLYGQPLLSSSYMRKCTWGGLIPKETD